MDEHANGAGGKLGTKHIDADRSCTSQGSPDGAAESSDRRVPREARSFAFFVGLAGFILWMTMIYVRYLRGASGIEQRYVDAAFDVLERTGEFVCLIGWLQSLYDLMARQREQSRFVRELHGTLLKDLNLPMIKADLTTVVRNSRSFLSVVGHMDHDVFRLMWSKFAREHDAFIMVGRFPIGVLEEFQRRKNDAGMRLRFYCNLGTTPDELINDILALCDEMGSDAARLYHVERFDPGAMIIGTDYKAAAVEALVDFSASGGERPVGFQVFGEAAVMLLTAVRARLAPPEAPSLPGNASHPVRIVSRRDADFVIEHRETYFQTINELYEGEPIHGAAAICERMTQLLTRIRTRLDVTHIASNAKTIAMLADPVFRSWIHANYAAASGTGRSPITVRRLFLIDSGCRNDAALLAAMREMCANGVQIRYLYLNEVEQSLHEDFSLYDEGDVIFVRYNGRGGWLPTSEARHSSNVDTVRAFRRVYERLFDRARSLDQSAAGLAAAD